MRFRDRLAEELDERRAPAPRWYVIGLAGMGAALWLIPADSGEIGAAYFETVAQVLPVLLLAVVLHEIALLGGAPRGIVRMRGALAELTAEPRDSDERDALVGAVKEFEGRAARLPETALDAPQEMRRILSFFGFGEAMSLLSLADDRYTVAVAVYVGLCLWVVSSVLARGIVARLTLAGNEAQIASSTSDRALKEPDDDSQ